MHNAHEDEEADDDDWESQWPVSLCVSHVTTRRPALQDNALYSLRRWHVPLPQCKVSFLFGGPTTHTHTHTLFAFLNEDLVDAFFVLE